MKIPQLTFELVPSKDPLKLAHAYLKDDKGNVIDLIRYHYKIEADTPITYDGEHGVGRFLYQHDFARVSMELGLCRVICRKPKAKGKAK